MPKRTNVSLPCYSAFNHQNLTALQSYYQFLTLVYNANLYIFSSQRQPICQSSSPYKQKEGKNIKQPSDWVGKEQELFLRETFTVKMKEVDLTQDYMNNGIGAQIDPPPPQCIDRNLCVIIPLYKDPCPTNTLQT